MQKGQILMVGHPHDGHYDLVAPHMDRPLVSIDLTAIPNGGELSFHHDGVHTSLVIEGEEITNVETIWWRHPENMTLIDLPLNQIQPFLREYCITAIKNHVRSVTRWFNGARWISHPSDMSWADSKPLQMQLAARAGLATPRTLQTSNPARAAQFIREEEWRAGCCIVKTCALYTPITPEREYVMFWSRKITSAVDLEGLGRAPAIFQQYIDGFDVRVIVVGNEVFATKITGDHHYEGPISDWRAVERTIQGTLLYEPYRLPEKVADGCIDLVRRLNLFYGAIDLRVDASGIHWFLENNTIGVFYFIEEATGQPIGKAVARLLMGVQ